MFDLIFHFGLAMFLTGLAGVFYTWAREVQLWNKGVSRFTGKPWIHFDTDSSGARGYTDGENYIWISYNIDK